MKETALPDPFAQLCIIGTTTPVDEERLPQRLTPVYQPLGDVELASGVFGVAHVLIPLDESAVAQHRFAVEVLEWFDEQVEFGESQRFDEPLPARANHVLLQVETGAPPCLIPAAELEDFLEKHYQSLLQKIEPLLASEDWERALYLGLQALRAADCRNSIPQLLVLGLSDLNRSASEIQWLRTEIAEAFTSGHLQRDWERFSRDVIDQSSLKQVRIWVERGLDLHLGRNSSLTDHPQLHEQKSFGRVRPRYLGETPLRSPSNLNHGRTPPSQQFGKYVQPKMVMAA